MRCSRFQWSAYAALGQVPRGRVISYKGLARLIGSKSPRAVGGALAKNPFPVVVPCHRVVCSDGRIGGFSPVYGKRLSGPSLKKRLLEGEGVAFDRNGKIPKKFFVYV